MNNKASSILQNAMALLLTASAALCLCLLTGCSHEELPETGKYNVSVKIDTKSLETEGEPVNSIVIYAFADVASGNSNLVGYLYSDDVNPEGVFPMILTEGGSVDFYVILNPKSNCYDFIDNDGNIVAIGTTPADDISPASIREWTIQYAATAPADFGEWELPMSNLDGAAYGNRRFNIVNRRGWQTVPISVNRAVSKVEVWFRSDGDSRNTYWGITKLTSSDPVKASGLFVETTDHIDNGESRKEVTIQSNWYYGTTDFPANADASHYYSEDNFDRIYEYYILPNTIGGNTSGDVGQSSDRENHTTLEVHYYHQGDPNFTETKLLSLPPYERNSCIKVWCALNSNEDRSFTYTVIDWDETVTNNIPDFS